jgi:hypothetical protein
MILPHGYTSPTCIGSILLGRYTDWDSDRDPARGIETRTMTGSHAQRGTWTRPEIQLAEGLSAPVVLGVGHVRWAVVSASSRDVGCVHSTACDMLNHCGCGVRWPPQRDEIGVRSDDRVEASTMEWMDVCISSAE